MTTDRPLGDPAVDPGANGRGSAPSAAPPIGGLDDVEWHLSYDRDSVDRFLVEVEAEKARLQDEIAAAERRTQVASERLAAQKAYNEDQLGALVVSARTELDRIEKEHADAVMAIRAAALEKSAHILEVARRDASAVGDASVQLSSVARPDPEGQGSVPSSTGAVVVPPGRADPEERTDVG